MAIDANIALQVKPLQIDSPVNAFGQIAQLQNAQTQNALGRIQMQQAQQGMTDQNSLREAARGFGDDPMANYQAILKTGNVKAAQDYLKSSQDSAKTVSEIGLNKSHAGEFDASATSKALASQRSMLSMVQTPDQFAAWVDNNYSNPATAKLFAPLGTPEEIKARIPKDPAQFQEFLQKNALGMDDFIKNKTAIRGQDLSSQTSLATNAATNQTHLQAAGIAASTSRANNAATIAKDFKVNGIDPQTGNFVGLGGGGGAMDGIIDAVGKNQLPLSTALARVPPAMKAGVMQQLLQKYPDFDETAIATRQKANKDFTTGTQGNAMRSFAVAGQHLDQLGTLVDALNNGNMQVVNKVGNYIAEQTGSPAPTNFDAAKDIVSKEVVKAIVAGGGGVAERQELADLMSKAKSPTQLKGVITQYRNLMGAQHEALLQQRDAAGLPRSSLPNYAGSAAPTAPAPSGWKYIGPAK